MKPSGIARNWVIRNKGKTKQEALLPMSVQDLCEQGYLRIHGGKKSSKMKEALNP